MIQYNNFLMKREQSRAGSRFAECEKSRLKAKILITLALLLTAVTGAWAADGELLVTITPDASGNIVYSVADIATLDLGGAEYNSSKGCWRKFGGAAYLTVTAADGINVTKVKFTTNKNDSWEDTDAPYQVQLDGGYALNASGSSIGTGDGIKKIEVYGTAEPPIEVTPVEGKTNEWTFTMPAYDVELTPLYAPEAKWAKDKEVDQLPTAIEGIIAGTEDAIVKAGTVVEGQGTAMYFATTDAEMTAEKAAAADGWLSTLPTAAGYDDAQTVYVWYYIKGADTPQGQEASAENTFNDSEICATPLTVTVLSNKFDIQFKAANANTIQAGKATVKVGETAAEVDEKGNLTGVKMNSKVTVTAKEGYKFRKATGKEGIVALKTLNVGGDCPGVLTYAEGETWGQAIQNHPTENTGWTIGSSGSILYDYYGVWLGNDRVKQGDAITPGLGYYTE